MLKKTALLIAFILFISLLQGHAQDTLRQGKLTLVSQLPAGYLGDKASQSATLIMYFKNGSARIEAESFNDTSARQFNTSILNKADNASYVQQRVLGKTYFIKKPIEGDEDNLTKEMKIKHLKGTKTILGFSCKEVSVAIPGFTGGGRNGKRVKMKQGLATIWYTPFIDAEIHGSGMDKIFGNGKGMILEMNISGGVMNGFSFKAESIDKSPQPDSLFLPPHNAKVITKDELGQMYSRVNDSISAYYNSKNRTDTTMEVIDSVKTPASIQPGDTLPDFQFKDKDGHVMKLSSLRGQYVLFNIWEPWAVSDYANKVVMKMYEKYKDYGLQVYTLSFEQDKEAWLKDIKKNKLSGPNQVMLNIEQPAGVIEMMDRAVVTPYLIGKDGKVIVAGLFADDLDKKLSELLIKK